MECLLCGKNYVNLGVHLRRKHHADLADYKEQFGLMKTTPLVDAELSEHISASARRRLLDPIYLAETTARCKENAAKNIGKSPAEFSQAAKDKLAERNRVKQNVRLDKLAPVVDEILRTKKTYLDVRRQLGMGRETVKKIVNMGKAAYSKDAAREVATQRAIASRMKNKAE